MLRSFLVGSARDADALRISRAEINPGAFAHAPSKAAAESLQWPENCVSRMPGPKSGPHYARAGRRIGHEIQARNRHKGSTAVLLADPHGERVQLGVVSLEEAVADNSALLLVQETVVAPLIQRCEHLCIWNVRNRANQASELAVRVGMPAPPADVRSRFYRVLFPCDQDTSQVREAMWRR